MLEEPNPVAVGDWITLGECRFRVIAKGATVELRRKAQLKRWAKKRTKQAPRDRSARNINKPDGPFVIIDSEGCGFGKPETRHVHLPGAKTATVNTFHRHGPFLWMASDGEKQIVLSRREPKEFGSPERAECEGLLNSALDRGETPNDGPIARIRRLPANKKRIGAKEIIDWLCELPGHFPSGAIFCIYCGGYDFTSILRELPYKEALALRRGCKLRDIDNPETNTEKFDNLINIVPVKKFGGIGFHYVKPIGLTLYRPIPLKDRGKNKSKKWKGVIQITDIFGNFQTGLIEAIKETPGACSPEDSAIIKAGKGLRDCMLMNKLRDGKIALGLKNTKWHGHGPAASAIMKKAGIPHHFELMKTKDVTECQEYASTAHFLAPAPNCSKKGFRQKNFTHTIYLARTPPSVSICHQ